MSLQHAAKYLANQGRGKDTMLVHMTPREVGSLQALALAQGGSLSINPETGLPEAGFLDSMLPMLLGAGLAAATGGTSLAFTPGMIGLGVGGLQALRTGDIGKGITAGLGAYGGAGLAGGLLGAAAASQAPTAALQSNIDPAMLEGMSAAQVEATRPTFMSALGKTPGLLKTSLAAASPFLMDEGDSDMPQAKGSGPNPYRYRFERGDANPFPELSQTGIERSYFPNARYVAYAGGGPVEAMSNANALGANTGFPMADIQRGAYATPYQQPISQNVVTGASDTRVDPYTGAERLAEGGTAKENPLLASPYRQEYLNENGSGANSAPGSISSGPGQGISSLATDIGLGLMSLSEGVPGIGSAIAGVVGNAMSGSQADAMGNAATALSDISAQGQTAPGVVSVSDSNGNVTSFSSPATVNAADVAMGLSAPAAPSVATEAQTAEAVSAALGEAAGIAAANGAAAASGVGPGGAPGGAGGDGGTGDAASATGDGGGDGGSADGGVGAGGLASGGISRLRYATGGLSDLGSYSDGGRLLRGPGDGVSDSIPAVIGQRQPARLADGEFVIPARIVSELGNGSTEAGARKLYAMMDRVQKARSKTVGKGKIAKNTRADKHLPA
jgi:hypothetical protein